MAIAKDKSQRLYKVRSVLIKTLMSNLLVAAAKTAYGLYTGSLTMLADGFHSLLDSASNILGIIVLSLSGKPPDDGHPYGHRKFEALAAIAISFLMFLASFEVLSESIHRMLNHEAGLARVTPISYIIMIISSFINFGISKYEERKAKEFGSSLLAADAGHTFSDVYVSLTVLFTLVAIQMKMPIIDLIGSAVIVLFILYAGYQIIVKHIGALVDAAVLDPALVAETVMNVQNVRGCHKIRSRGFDEHVFLDLHIQVPSHFSIEQAHSVSFAVEARLREVFGSEIDVLVHVEDDNPDVHPGHEGEEDKEQQAPGRHPEHHGRDEHDERDERDEHHEHHGHHEHHEHNAYHEHSAQGEDLARLDLLGPRGARESSKL